MGLLDSHTHKCGHAPPSGHEYSHVLPGAATLMGCLRGISRSQTLLFPISPCSAQLQSRVHIPLTDMMAHSPSVWELGFFGSFSLLQNSWGGGDPHHGQLENIPLSWHGCLLTP